MCAHVTRSVSAVIVALVVLLAVAGSPSVLARRPGGVSARPAVGARPSGQAVPAQSILPRPSTGLRPAQTDPTPPSAPKSLIPFDPAPAFVLPTTGGTLTFGAGQLSDVNTVLLGNAPRSLLSPVLWSGSMTKMLAHSPDDVNYVFMSYAPTQSGVDADIAATGQWIEAALATMPAEERAYWSAHLVQASVNPLELGGEVRDLLIDWGDVFADVSAVWPGAGSTGQVTARGATDSGWARSLADTGTVTGPVTAYGNLACGSDAPVAPITGTIALIERGVCPFTEKVANAEAHGAIAALLYTTADRPVATMLGSCTTCPDIPAVLIDRQSGLDIQTQISAGRAVSGTLAPDIVPEEAMAVDHRGRVRAFGTIPFPWNDSLGSDAIDALQSVAYEADYLHYERLRDNRMRAEESGGRVTIVPAFTGEWLADPGWAGQRGFAEVALPGPEAMARFDTLELDLTLSCQDHWRSNCPSWDYIVNLYLCEQDRPDRCDLEVGRWITPYWAEGRWLTDVSPLLGFLREGGTRRFAFYTQQRYQVDLTLRLSNRAKGMVPRQAYDLGLNGGAFWRDYNAHFRPIAFDVPEWATKVELVSVISGHGWGQDVENCAEFCNHTHHYAVNGRPSHDLTHPMAGTLDGCAEQVVDGVTPNQSGTWIYGRGGWCPGLEVKPWTVDITRDVRTGPFNTLNYRGLFNGRDYVAEKDPSQPPNQGFDARIDMRAYLVYWAPMTAPYPFDLSTLFLPRALRSSD